MRTALVTGGTTRLGRVIAERLRRDGWRVVTTSHRSDSGAERILDFRKLEMPSDLSGVDAIVNNAALYIGAEEDIGKVNFLAPKRLTELLAETVADAPKAVVNILDGCGKGGAAYRASKERLRGYTFGAARTYAGRLRVNAVSPGPLIGLSPTEIHEKADDCPFGRPTPEQVADAVAFLLGNPAVTGVDIPVDGGLTCGRRN